MCARASVWVAVLSVSLTAVAADNPLTTSRSTLERWVETRQHLARAQADWQSDRELLLETRRLFERELSTLADQFGKLSTNSVQADRERAEAEALQQASQAALERARGFATELEAALRPLVPKLPVPLQDTLKPLLARLPTDTVNTRMSVPERVQVLVGILSELDKFNTALTLTSEKQRNPQGEEVAVETVYVGLGIAYFVNDANDFAGIGTPGPNGWEWQPKPELAGAVRDVVRIYRNEQGARFVALPATVR